MPRSDPRKGQTGRLLSEFETIEYIQVITEILVYRSLINSTMMESGLERSRF